MNISLYWNRIDAKQAVKIALAAILSLFLIEELDLLLPRPQILVSGLWTVVAAIVVLQAYVGGTYKAVINRFTGVLVGSVIGASFADYLGGNSLVLGLAIFTTILICSLFDLKESYRIAALSVCVIIIPWMMHPELSPWSYAFFRFLDTCLGIIVAVFIAHVVWPSEASAKVKGNLSEVLDLSRQYWRSIFTQESKEKRIQLEEELSEEINALLNQTRLILDESRLEHLINDIPFAIWLEIIINIESLFSNLFAISKVYDKDLEDIFDEELRQQVLLTIDKIQRGQKMLSHQLKNGNNKAEMEDFEPIKTGLRDQLTRFRSTRATANYSFSFVERYFVFFYTLRSILQQLHHLNKQITIVQKENDTSAS